MHFVMAGIPANQLEALIKLLVTACAVTSSGETNKDLRAIATSVASGAKRADQALVTDVTGILMNIIKGDEVDQDELAARMKELRTATKLEIASDRKFDHATIDFLRVTSAYLINNGEPALRKLRTLVNELGDPVLQKAMAPQAASQRDFVKPLENIVNKIAKRKDTVLTKEELEKLKKKNLDVFREYMRLRKQYNLVWKDEMNAYVVKSKQKAVPYKDVVAYLNSKKIDHPLLPGFEGLLDANGRAYTTAGKAINGGVPTKSSGFTVKMNPNYNPKTDNEYVFTTLKDGKTSQHVYTMNYRKGKNVKKFGLVHELMDVIDKVQKTWVPFMRRHDFSKSCVVATVMQLVYSVSARVGTKGNQTVVNGRKVSTYGIATIQARHVKIVGSNKAVITYQGKDAVRQQHTIDAGASPEAKLVFNNLKLFLEGRQPNDSVFQYETVTGNRLKPVVGADLKNLLAKWGGPEGATIHKVRHVQGTRLFMAELEKHKKEIEAGDMSQAEADRLFKVMLQTVGSLLGHVRGVGKQQKVDGNTAFKNYIDPGVMLGYYDALNLRPPRALEKIRKQAE